MLALPSRQRCYAAYLPLSGHILEQKSFKPTIRLLGQTSPRTPKLPSSLSCWAQGNHYMIKKGVLRHFLSAARTAIARCWKSVETPSIGEWVCEMDIIGSFGKMIAREEKRPLDTLDAWFLWDYFKIDWNVYISFQGIHFLLPWSEYFTWSPPPHHVRGFEALQLMYLLFTLFCPAHACTLLLLVLSLPPPLPPSPPGLLCIYIARWPKSHWGSMTLDLMWY